MTAKPNIGGLIEILITPVQELEDAIEQVRLSRLIESVTTRHAIAMLGKLVGQPDAGLDLEVYRRFIRARIAVNSSRGAIRDVINVIRLLLGNTEGLVEVQSHDYATIVATITGQTDVDLVPTLIDNGLMDFLQDAVAAGVRIIAEYPTVAPAASFTFENGPGLGFPASAKLDMAGPMALSGPVVAARISGVGGNSQTISLVADGAGAGSLTDGAAAVFHYQTAVTTLANLWAAIDASAWLRVYDDHAVSGAATLGAGDAFAATALTGGVAGGKLAGAQSS